MTSSADIPDKGEPKPAGQTNQRNGASGGRPLEHRLMGRGRGLAS